MKVFLHAIGKWKACPERDLFDRYQKRLSSPLLLKEFELKRTAVDSLKNDEAKLLVDPIPDKAFVILLDEHGTSFSSSDFARQLEAWQGRGHDLYFLIGGADGHGQAAQQRADFTLSLGPLTFPHLLVRSLLAEQLYRAYSLLSGHPYHRA